MRSLWVGVAMGVGVMLSGAPAWAAAAPAARAPRAAVGFMPVGALNYIWKGDPARGCAAEGLCGVVGSLQVVSGGSSSISSPGPTPIDLQDSGAVARVQMSAADGAQRACADLVPYDVQFDLRHGAGGRLRAVADIHGSQPPSPGRCAGPTAADLAAVTLPARLLGRRGYDLTGSTAFGAGPFSVTVVSTIRALFVSSSQFSGAPPPSSGNPGPRVPRPRPALQEQVDVSYRVVAVQGGLTASFAGLAQPFCTPLDACSTTGAVALALRASSHRFEFSGGRIVKRRVRSRQALADLRAGRLGLSNRSFTPQLGGELTGTLTGANLGPCRDTVSAPPLYFNEFAGHGGWRLILGQSGSGPGVFGPDELRTRCPGPGSGEILGNHPLAVGVVAARDLGASHLRVVVSAAGQFRGTAYAGTRSGSIVLTLVRTHVSAGTRRVHIIGGQAF